MNPARKPDILTIGMRLLLLSVPFVVHSARAIDSSDAGLFEPTVTRQEADLLREVAEFPRDNRTGAIALLREQISDQSSPALDFALGNFLYQDDRLDEAEQAYNAAVDKMPAFREALNNLVRVYLIQEKPEEAIGVFQKLLRDGQGDSQTLLLLGHCLLLLDKPVQAEGAYRQSLVLEPDDPDAMRGLIKSLIGQQRNAEVLSLTRELQNNSPYDEELWNLRANAHLALEQPLEAITSLETARLLDRASPDMLVMLGDLHLHGDRPRDAVAAYRQAFSIEEPDAGQMLRAVEGLLSIEGLAEAEELLQRIRSSEANHPLPFGQGRRAKLEGRLAAMQGDFDQAGKSYESVIRESPLDGEAMIALAAIRNASGRAGEGRILLERAARIEGFEARALVRLAELEVEQERFQMAVTLLERAQVFKEQPHVARYLEQVRRIAQR
jgi:Flp pilus assembly protein TadD